MRVARLSSMGPLACTLAVGLVSCDQSIATVEGSCGDLYDARVCTWATVDGGEVVEFGATVPVEAIESAPADLELVFPPMPVAIIPLPAEVEERIGFNHLMINWENHGHPPALFAVPHFDFHFYTVDPATVSGMDCGDVRKPEQLSAGYALPDITIEGLGELVGLCVPGMGMHAMLAEEIDQTEPFGASMIVGYYGGDVIFLEPMIARSKLLAAEGFTMAIPEVKTAAAGMQWPSRFEAIYDDANRTYRFTFSHLGG
ncbi:MAG: hypothetical protein GTO46_04140 [Gemmatimonadetes bacterium]|nr:hypothetical protein [Gemmatimonadota bacterium]NIO30914.1 hypothetical protein [Gemmatimonadota bacterium]